MRLTNIEALAGICILKICFNVSRIFFSHPKQQSLIISKFTAISWYSFQVFNMSKIPVYVLIFFCAFQFVEVHAQSHPLPIEVKKAFRNATRSVDGNPGPAYWQNRASYKIEAELLADESILKCSERVQYFNNSPDTLNQLVVRIYADFYKKGTARQWPIGGDDLTDGMLIENLKVFQSADGENIIAETNRTPTNLILSLKTAILPGDSLTLEMDWEIIIPQKKWARMGNYGGDKFFLAYWYPQIAVYDDIDGWDRIEYFGMVEFYNDFSDFDVQIKTPPGFLVWATGSLENAEQIYEKNTLKKLEKAKQSDEVVHIVTAEDHGKKRVLKNAAVNTWNYTAVGVSDFSFAAAKNALWDGTSLVVDNENNRRVLTDAVFTDEPRTYAKAAEWSRKSVAYMSEQLPAYPFPYQHMTSVSNGRKGGGMETPMMANNGDPKNEANSYATLFHEISHSYFPFFMGTNERKYAWMDEGWAAFLPIGFMQEYFPDNGYFKRILQRFEGLSGSEKEVTLMTLSYQIGDYNSYRIHAYNRSAMAYYYLQDALGDSLFKQALHAYIDRWKGKHPLPYDFFNTFSNVSGQDLAWFFKPWFFNRSYADLGIKKVTMDNQVVVENYGGLPLPVKLIAEFTDGSKEEINRKTSIWSSGNQAVVVQFEKEKQLKRLVLGDDLIPDTNDENNVFEIEN